MKEKAKEEGVQFIKLTKVIALCWNSHAMCLLRVLDQQKVVQNLCSDRSLGLWGFMFTEVEWEIMQQLEDILEVSKYRYIHVVSAY